MRLSYYLLAFLIAKVALRWAMVRGRVVIMDRSFMDFVADLARAKIPHRSLPEPVIRMSAPKGCLMFIDAQPETVVRRKGELTREKAEELRGRYLHVARILGATVVNGDDVQDTVYCSVLSYIDSWYRSQLTRIAGT